MKQVTRDSRTTCARSGARSNLNNSTPRLRLQRKCACGRASGPSGDCAECRRKRLQRSAWVGQAPDVAPPVVHHVLLMAGQPLHGSVRSTMEMRLGHTFDNVRVHTDDTAAASAQAVQARAYTVGRHIVFDAGQYAPGTSSGKDLLAHELAHVMQQQGATGGSAGSLPISQPHDAAEQAADRLAHGRDQTGAGRTGAQVARAPAGGPPAFCKGATRSSMEFSVQASAMTALVAPDTGIPLLYRSLKRIRTCFPAFVEKDFLSIVTIDKFYPDAKRKEIGNSYGAAIRKDDRKLAWRESQKPFAGYEVSGYDPSERFTKPEQMRQFGYEAAPGHQDVETQGFRPSEASDRSKELKELRETSRTAQKPFSEADVLVFSGHQYAQYKVPGVWTDDNMADPSIFDIRTLKPPLDNVKLVVSTSCATICKDPAAIWKSLFPKAVFLGYKKSAPLNGATMAQSFVKRLPKDFLFEAGGQSAAVSAWKGAIKAIHKGDSTREPGWLDVPGNQVEYWTGSKFKKVAADSVDNQCKEKGDQSASVPDPGDWRGPASP
ncbi:MAG: DUF4157 domain-containing protein [Caldilineaceae bacterium]|nr:DUF4157 domain-containing protein [Caldilineaceae bacterium]